RDRGRADGQPCRAAVRRRRRGSPPPARAARPAVGRGGPDRRRGDGRRVAERGRRARRPPRDRGAHERRLRNEHARPRRAARHAEHLCRGRRRREHRQRLRRGGSGRAHQSDLMAEITSGRARRMLSVGRLTTAVGGSYLWQAIKRPFQSASRRERTLLETHIRNAQRVVARSKELRGAFMKLAQMLSMRSDLLPAEALEVLSVVQSSVPPMPWARIRRVLAAELGAPPEERFRRFEREAFAAASLGQVHRAELARGQRVAVKVQYPGVAATVQQDLKNVKALLRVFTAMARDLARQDVDTGEVAAELEALLREELDYLNEAANLQSFRRLLADVPELLLPSVQPKLTARRLLPMH